MKIATIVSLAHPFVILIFTAISSYVWVYCPGFVESEGGWLNNPGFHGFSEMLYEYTSSSANNGSGFEGLSDNTPFWNITTGIVLIMGRYFPIVGQVAIAGLLAGKKFAVVPILRAGLGLVDGVLRMVPSARVGHIGMFRDEDTLEPHVYFCKMPKDIDQRICLVVDPMLATGGSAEMAISYLRERGVKDIRMLCIVAAPEGLKSLTEKDPDVHIYTCAIDDHLNEAAYIVPGLGDAGDRIYGTK